LPIGGIAKLDDEAGYAQIESLVVAHVQVVEGANAQPRGAGLTQEAEESAPALLEPEVLSDQVLEVGEAAREIGGGEHGPRVPAFRHGPLHLVDHGLAQPEVDRVEADLEPLGLEAGVERLADPGLVGVLPAIAQEDVIFEPIIRPLPEVERGGLAAPVEGDR